MSNLEYLAALLGIVNIVLIVLRSLWNYPFGIAMVALSFFVFFEAKLYSDALLQIFFFVVQLYGWWSWLKGRDTQGTLIVERAGARTMVGWSLGIVVATGLWGWLMHALTNAAFPWWDAAVAMTSIAAQIMMSRRWIENWALWVLVDALAVGLYAARDLWAFAGLYTVFLVVAAWGWWEWIRVGREQRAVSVLPA